MNKQYRRKYIADTRYRGGWGRMSRSQKKNVRLRQTDEHRNYTYRAQTFETLECVMLTSDQVYIRLEDERKKVTSK